MKQDFMFIFDETKRIFEVKDLKTQKTIFKATNMVDYEKYIQEKGF